jgi:FHS family L-fucose permease-like MFS transporter
LVFVLVTALFLLWGIPANLNNVLIKQFMKSFEISRFQAGLIQSDFYMGYFLLALPAALIMRKYSYKTGFVFGLMLYGTGALLFWRAAVVRHYGYFLLALFVMASGLAFLETGANPFIAVLGDPRTSERRLNFELESAIREYLVPCNQSPKPFVWVETAGEILAPAFSELQIQDFITR